MLILGKPIADQIKLEIKEKITALKANAKLVPGLAVILVGNDAASQVYVAMKKKACLELGLESFEYLLPANTNQTEIANLIQKLNNNPKVNGILLQLPLPKHLDENTLLDLISPSKDVDGFHPVNIGKLLLGRPCFKSCTPYGVCELLKAYKIETEGKQLVIIGRSNIVGKPLAAMLMQKEFNATVTVAHSKTQNLAQLCQTADILVAAIGQPRFVKASFIKPGAVVIDVGITSVPDPTSPKGTKLIGDVDFASVEPIASAITPVPGGVGPMTIAMLMKNTMLAAV